MSSGELHKGFQAGSALVPARVGSAVTGKNYIITIGIDRYASEAIPNFEYNNCKKDCTDLVHTLQNEYLDFESYGQLCDEEATREAIENKIQEFIDDKKKNTLENGLLIFFSGHGGIVERGLGKVGCWFPTDCTEKEYKKVFTVDVLDNLLAQMRTRDLIIISDSCNSGEIFTTIKAETDPSSRTINGQEFSSWALVSSRSDQFSKAGAANENSYFTRKLLYVLQQPGDEHLNIYKLIGALEDLFVNDTGQRPVYGRLDFTGRPNNGVFAFRYKNVKPPSSKEAEYLRRALFTFNYHQQADGFKTFNPDEKKQISFFSGRPESGLSLIALRAKKSTRFPGSKADVCRAAPLTGMLMSDNFVLDYFTQALGVSFATEAALEAEIMGRLRLRPLLFELRIYSGDDGPSLPPAHKKRMLDELAAFAARISNAGPDYHSLILFVIDQEDCDYSALYGSGPVCGIPAWYMPPVEVMTEAMLTDWYDQARDFNSADDDKLEEFDNLFQERVCRQLPVIVQQTGGAPGEIIREICRFTLCTELANELLTC